MQRSDTEILLLLLCLHKCDIMISPLNILTSSYLEETSHAIHPYCHPKNEVQGNGCELTCESPQSNPLLATEQPEPAW